VNHLGADIQTQLNLMMPSRLHLQSRHMGIIAVCKMHLQTLSFLLPIRPICEAMAVAVDGWSPVIMNTLMPASLHC
jgi:hypothetical protein